MAGARIRTYTPNPNHRNGSRDCGETAVDQGEENIAIIGALHVVSCPRCFALSSYHLCPFLSSKHTFAHRRFDCSGQSLMWAADQRKQEKGTVHLKPKRARDLHWMVANRVRCRAGTNRATPKKIKQIENEGDHSACSEGNVWGLLRKSSAIKQGG